MIGYRFDCLCPRCGGCLEHVNGTSQAGSQSIAVARCEPCKREWTVNVQLREMPRESRFVA